MAEFVPRSVKCKYHVVFIPKYRRKVLYGKFRQRIGPILREWCRQKGVELLEGHLMVDHVHMCLSIPPKYSVAHTIGLLKGKSAVRIHRALSRERLMTGPSFWASLSSVRTVGLVEQTSGSSIHPGTGEVGIGPR